MARLNSAEALEQMRQEVLGRRDAEASSVAVCVGTGCLASGAQEVFDTFEAEIAANGLATVVEFRGTGCHGFCEKGPIVVIEPGEICYLQVAPDDVSEIVERTVIAHQIVDRLLFDDPAAGEKVLRESDIPFYKHQERM
ncbi:MAG: (2Fe-2S) ferredoxin domain-containing protein, partial [Myxococcota bacterium]|nr:(2Fe-2S) ferredoxin domain-containing protein [Myxococcota bacterium]